MDVVIFLHWLDTQGLNPSECEKQFFDLSSGMLIGKARRSVSNTIKWEVVFRRLAYIQKSFLIERKTVAELR